MIALAPGVALASQSPGAAEASPAQSAEPLEHLGFLAGTWRGSMEGGAFVEEIWSAPHGPSIMGAFRWCRPDGAPVMFEILTITAEEEVIRLRLRHYSSTLAAKEPSDKPLTLVLKEQGPEWALFTAEGDAAGDLASVRYEVVDEELRIVVSFVAREGEDPEQRRPPLRFRLRRG